MSRARDFILSRTEPAKLDFLPEISLYTARSVETLWKEIEAITQDPDCPVPFWATPWAGGLALARYILDNPHTVKGCRVLDFASGSGLVAIAAAMAGAKTVSACEIDPIAKESISLNAELNRVELSLTEWQGHKVMPKKTDVILAGDVCYEHLMAHRSLAWMRLCVASGKMRAIIGEPGRGYAPKEGIIELDRFTVPTNLELEDTPSRDVAVLEITA